MNAQHKYQEEFIEIPVPAIQQGRVEALDLARGIAVALMILSHTVKGLLSFEQMPDWGLVPVHALTKFSSSLFFTVFGMSLALFFLPAVETKSWAQKRNRLWLKSLEIMVWYKILTIVQMYKTYPTQAILDSLAFKTFPDFVEVLGFYSFCLLWIPFALLVWAHLPSFMKPILILGFALIGYRMTQVWNPTSYLGLKAILVEHPGYFTFGQLQRGAMVLFGLWIGEFWKATGNEPAKENRFALYLIGAGLIGLGYFFFSTITFTDKALLALAKNYGKHPPSLLFVSFSLGGALCLIGFSYLFTPKVPTPLKMFVYIGQKPFFAFCFHIVVIFILFRDLCDFHRKVNYAQALQLSGMLIVITSVFSYALIKRQEGAR